MLAGSFLLFLAMRWWLVARYTTPVPFWDEWIDDGPLFRHFVAGTLTWEYLLTPFHDHRILWQRLYKLAVFLINGQQWDSRVQAAANALLGAAIPLLILAQFGRRNGPRTLEPFVWVVTALFFLVPVLWTNVTWAFQVALYSQMLWALAAWGLLAGAAGPRESRWWLGCGCLVAGLFTTGSGSFAALALAVSLLWLAIPQRKIHWGQLGTLGVALLLVIWGVILRQTEAEIHDLEPVLTAQSLQDVIGATYRNFTWPLSLEAPDRSVYAPGLLLWVPAPLLVLLYIFQPAIRQRLGLTRREMELFLPALLWVLGQVLVLIIFRGKDGNGPSWRHYDVHALGLVLNAWALVRLAPALPDWRWPARRWRTLLLTAYLGLALGGVLMQMSLTSIYLGWRDQANFLQPNTLRRYFVELDKSVLTLREGVESPFLFQPDADLVLDDPIIRSILPTPLRQPLTLRPVAGTERFAGTRIPPLAEEKLRYATVLSSWPPPPGLDSLVAEWEIPPSPARWVRIYYTAPPPGHPGQVRISTAPKGQPGQRVIRSLPTNLRFDWESVILPLHAGNGGTLLRVELPGPQSWIVFTPPAELGPLAVGVERALAARYGLALAGVMLLLAGGWLYSTTVPAAISRSTAG